MDLEWASVSDTALNSFLVKRKKKNIREGDKEFVTVIAYAEGGAQILTRYDMPVIIVPFFDSDKIMLIILSVAVLLSFGLCCYCLARVCEKKKVRMPKTGFVAAGKLQKSKTDIKHAIQISKIPEDWLANYDESGASDEADKSVQSKLDFI